MEGLGFSILPKEEILEITKVEETASKPLFPRIMILNSTVLGMSVS